MKIDAQRSVIQSEATLWRRGQGLLQPRNLRHLGLW